MTDGQANGGHKDGALGAQQVHSDGTKVLLVQHIPDIYTLSVNTHPIACLPPLTGFKKTKGCFIAVWYLPRGLLFITVRGLGNISDGAL